MNQTRSSGMAVVVLLIALSVVTRIHSQSQSAANALAAFPEPDRRGKLSAAFFDIDRQVAAFMERSHVPGAVWGVIVDGELAHVGVAGLRDLETKAAVRRDTVFRIASMTKSFTAMAIVKLRDEGKLSLDDPAERYVPELKGLKYPTSDSPRITIRHLLTHSEGFPEDNPWGDQQLSATEEQFTEMLRQGIPFSNAPGVAYEYSNYGFAILGRVIATVSGRPYRDYLQEEILRPLGMTSTTLDPASVPRDRIARGYRWEDDTWKDEPPLPDGAFGAMGGMLTSIDDLGKYVSAYLASWPPRDGPERGPISRASLREMQQVWRWRPAIVTSSAPDTVQLNAGGYGYGLRITQTCDFGHIVAHGGGLPGFGSTMQWFPEYGVGIIAFGNVTYAGWGGVTNRLFIDPLVKTGGLKPRVPQPSDALVQARDSVSRLILKWDDGEADRVAAMNLFLDRSKERRRREIEELTSKAGQCAMPTTFDAVENALRGVWTMRCERANLRVAITLAPTVPPRVQFLSMSQAPPVQASGGACRVQ